MGKEMICPLCRYLHKDQPFTCLESEDGIKPSSSQATRVDTSSSRASTHLRGSNQPSPHSPTTWHEHPTSGTVLSMMPSLFETSLGHGPTAGTIRTSPDGICLKTSTWLMLYAMPFLVALCFLAFVLGKVETMWSKVSCLIGAAICYMVCWGLVVAIMDPDHEARAILEQLNRMQELADMAVAQDDDRTSTANQATTEGINGARTTSTIGSHSTFSTLTHSSPSLSAPWDSSTTTNASSDFQGLSWTSWTQHRYAVNIRNRLSDLSRILDELPDMMGEW